MIIYIRKDISLKIMLKRNRKEDEMYKKLMQSESRVKRIRCKCLDCSAYSYKEVRECPVKDCPLWIFRMGRKVKE